MSQADRAAGTRLPVLLSWLVIAAHQACTPTTVRPSTVTPPVGIPLDEGDPVSEMQAKLLRTPLDRTDGNETVDATGPAEQSFTTQLLAEASELEAIALFRSTDLIVSGLQRGGPGASCRKTTSSIECFEFSGTSFEHLARVFDKASYRPISTPPWALRMFELDAKATAADRDDVASIEVSLDAAEPVLIVHGSAGDRFAIRRDGRWRLSEEKSGGKSTEPFYFGAVDTSELTEQPSIGLILGEYVKESCIRYETIDLEIMRIEHDKLVDIGAVRVGVGVWIYVDHTKFGLFDDRDPNHYRVLLQPTVEHGRLRLEVESRHTPRDVSRLRKLARNCGMDLDAEQVDDLAKRAGVHTLSSVME